MNLDNLCQFNSDLFLELLGKYICQRRMELRLSLQDASEFLQLSAAEFEQIEKGQFLLKDHHLLLIIPALSLDESEILNLAKITQVRQIMEVTKELDAGFPR